MTLNAKPVDIIKIIIVYWWQKILFELDGMT